MKNKTDKNKIVIFEGKKGAVYLNYDNKERTIWATQAEMAAVFAVNTQAITKHIQNIYAEKELIKTRNKLFLDRNVLFAHLGEEKSRNFKKLFLGLDNDDQEMIWKWLDAFVVLTEKSIK